MITETRTSFIKNAKGSEEIAKRTFGLNPRIRQLLILIDGKRSNADLIKMLPAFDVAGTLQLLLDEGFISGGAQEFSATNVQSSTDIGYPADNESVQQRSSRVARLLTQTLGPNADDLALRIERCKSFDEIRELIPQVFGVIEGVAGSRAMADFTRKLGNI